MNRLNWANDEISFGVMQGRLSHQTARGYQSFPWEEWRDEFGRASERNLNHIEWVLDTWNAKENPILKEISDVQKLVGDSGVKVVSVCADFLMDSPLDSETSSSWELLEELLESMETLQAKSLIIPCVDASSLQSQDSLDRFLRASNELANLLSGTSVEVALETDLDPTSFMELMNRLDSEKFKVNYDIGNSASLGYHFDEEYAAYGDRISVVHVKDRLLHGASVPLGSGHAQIVEIMNKLHADDFRGTITMQAFRDTSGIDIFDQQLDWLIQLQQARI